MAESDEDLVLIYLLKRKKRTTLRKMWVRDMFLCRYICGEYHHLLGQLTEDDEYYRMSF